MFIKILKGNALTLDGVEPSNSIENAKVKIQGKEALRRASS